jgi:hypothetical protein
LRLLVRAGQKTADETGLLGYINEKSIVTVVRFQFNISHIAIPRAQGANNFL